jgi:hypothetical protein
MNMLLLAASLSTHCKKSSTEERSDAFNALLGVWHWEAYFIDQYGDGLEFELDDCDADDTWEFKSSTKLALERADEDNPAQIIERMLLKR